jgi:hypothetical protein
MEKDTFDAEEHKSEQRRTIRSAVLALVQTAWKKRISLKWIVVLALIALMPSYLRYLRPTSLQPPLPLYEDGRLGVTEFIRQVKSELNRAEDERIKNQEEAGFRLKDFDLEISFVVKVSSAQNGKVEYQLVTVDNQLRSDSERIQKLTLHMVTVEPSVAPSDENGGQKVITVDPIPAPRR